MPEGVKTFAINPLTWSCGSQKAPKALNAGACFTDYSGDVVREVPQLTGCYIDSERWHFKSNWMLTKKEFVPGLSLFSEGVYHIYDYQFFTATYSRT